MCSEAITGAIFEIIQRHVAQGDVTSLPMQLPQLVYIAIAPFIGCDKAIELVEEIRRGGRRRVSARSTPGLVSS
jgi:hypothetical protein